MSLRRMAAILRKEILHIIRDPRNLFLVTVSPAFLLLLLANIFSFDVRTFNLAALDLDHTSVSRRYLASLTSDPDLLLIYTAESYEELEPLLISGKIDAALVLPPGFGETIRSGETAQVQAIIDGTDPFAGSQAVASLAARSGAFVIRTETVGAAQASEPVEIRSQAWYNAGLESLYSMVPGLLAIVLIMPAMAMALAMAREKETGTLEGLVATPVLGSEYIIGKLLAYIIAGLISALLALLVAVVWFRVPFRGSLAVYVMLAADYFLACMAATVVIANFVKSQQTAMFIVLIIFIVPSFFLAGLISPVSTESLASMLTSYAMPSTHFVETNRAVFLKGLDLRYLLRPALALLGMGMGALTIGLLSFRKKVG
jgi:ABC-2 type transport system permease protein